MRHLHVALALAVLLGATAPLGASALEASPLPAVPPQATGARAAELPEGCTQDPLLILCEWWLNTTEASAASANPDGPSLEVEAPTWSRALVTITVLFEGQDAGWRYDLWAVGAENASLRRLSASNHPQSTSTSHAQTDTHVATLEFGEVAYLAFRPSHIAAGEATARAGFASSLGTFRIVYLSEPLPEGVTPSRPAATLDDPHVTDVARDAAEPEADLVAAWFDDSALGDGLFDAFVAVASLEDIEQRETLVEGLGSASRSIRYQWSLEFDVAGRSYDLRWFTVATEQDEHYIACTLFERTSDDTPRLITRPLCDHDNATATLHAVVPERALGEPAPGVLFEAIRATSYVTYQGSTGNSEVLDETTTSRYAFALGGPEVWHALNPRLTAPDALAGAWYEDPLASENLPDTLQVAGALLGLVMFLAGALLVRRSRRALREVIERIDRVERSYEDDVRRALLELGKLESDLTHAFRDGRMRENAYQVAQQRIAAVATRLALRREFGLDDGVPDLEVAR